MIMKVRNFTRLLALRKVFHMYYLYGVSGPSLLIESTNSMIMNIVIDKAIKRIIRNFCAAPIAVVFS